MILGSNPRNGAQTQVNERNGLFSPPQDHASLMGEGWMTSIHCNPNSTVVSPRIRPAWIAIHRNCYSVFGNQCDFGIRAFRIGSFHLLVSTS